MEKCIYIRIYLLGINWEIVKPVKAKKQLISSGVVLGNCESDVDVMNALAEVGYRVKEVNRGKDGEVRSILFELKN